MKSASHLASVRIIADDLTGACDAAVAFACVGMTTEVCPAWGSHEIPHTQVVEACRAQGIDCEGPAPPDTIFFRAAKGSHDLIVAMYHDQGHIPMKLLDFEATANTSLGIPIIRTSVDHGTAFDIAGKNIAGEGNMLAAMKMAATMAGNHLLRNRVQVS